MNEKQLFEESLKRVFAPSVPSPHLKVKAMSLRPRRSRKPLWIACGAAGLAAAAFATVFVILPATSVAQAVIKQASSFEGHLSTYMVLPNGRWLRTGDEWIKGGMQRIIDEDGVRTEFLHDSERGLNIALNGYSGTVTIRDVTKRAKGMAQMPDILTLQNLKEFLARQGISGPVRTERTQFNGQPADCVSFSMGKYWDDKLYAGPVTHRMLGWSYRNTKVWPQNPPENNYTRVCVVDPKPLPDHIFDPVFIVNGAQTDVLADRAKWQARLSKPLRVFTVNLRRRRYLGAEEGALVRTISVRNVMVNPSGDVFVLFTGGNGAYGTNIVPTTIHDSAGGRYVKCASFMPCDDGPRAAEGFSFEGEPLEGGWFVRLGGGEPHGLIAVGFRQEFEPETHFAFTFTMEPERISGEFPAYMPYMFLPIGTHNKWLELRMDELAQDRDRSRDYAGEETYLRKLIQLENTLGSRSFILPVESLCCLAHALEQQGKEHEAYATYQQARTALSESRPDPGDWAKKRIDSGIARLGPRPNGVAGAPVR